MFMFRKIFAVLISFILFFSFVPGVPYSVKDAENIKMSAVILSDVHIEGNNPDRWERFGNTLNGVFSADRLPDVVAFTGDNTMNGQWVEWLDFYGLLNRYNKGSNVIVSFGNHDFGNNADHKDYARLSKRCLACYNGYCGKNISSVYYTTEVNGYKFIALSSEDNAENTVSVITDSQIEWLKGELKKAADKGMPAFVLNHNLIEGKNGRRSYWDFNITDNNEKLAQALESCGTKVIYFCGHSHIRLDYDQNSVNTVGNVTYVNLPSVGNIPDYSSYDNEEMAFGTGCCLEAYEDCLLLRFRSFGENKWVKGFEEIKIDL